jgi:hypothetical protein
MYLENRLGDVETDCRDRLHVWLLRIVGALAAPTSMALTCRVEEPSTASNPDLQRSGGIPFLNGDRCWPCGGCELANSGSGSSKTGFSANSASLPARVRSPRPRPATAADAAKIPSVNGGLKTPAVFSASTANDLKPRLSSFASRLRAIAPLLHGLAGQSARAIAAELNARQVPTPTGAPWSAKTVIQVRGRLKRAPL